MLKAHRQTRSGPGAPRTIFDGTFKIDGARFLPSDTYAEGIEVFSEPTDNGPQAEYKHVLCLAAGSITDHQCYLTLDGDRRVFEPNPTATEEAEQVASCWLKAPETEAGAELWKKLMASLRELSFGESHDTAHLYKPGPCALETTLPLLQVGWSQRSPEVRDLSRGRHLTWW